MPIERILIRIMIALGIIFIFLDVMNYSGRSTPFLFLMLAALFAGDVLLKKPSKAENGNQKKVSYLEKIILGIIIVGVVALSVSLAILWKLGPFGRL